jgi:hypothetical protein
MDNLYTENISCCGCKCNECDFYNISCKGCSAEIGAPYWVQYIEKNVCPIYQCCINEKSFTSCSKCNNLPCKIYYESQDPTMTEEEHNNSVLERVNILKNK